jgi:two-component system response regulator (stage 0 sporulation protein F)
MPTVLIIDDVHLFSDVVGKALRNAGYEVLIASNGREGLDMLRARRPSLVILDIAMPVMGGIEALQAIRADSDPAVAHTQVLVVSASTGPTQEAEATRLGVHGRLLKSRFSLADLVARVRELVPPNPRPRE